ncbi:MAG TPA: PEGA domain-containing protein [Polyangia bacterium]|nr:PEGA domain-containing protein [Polyangia bacterium]
MESLSSAKQGLHVVVLRLASLAPDIDTFVAEYGRYLHGDEIFLVTPAPALRGMRVRFRLELLGGERVLEGRGTVRRVHGGHPNLIPGMDVAFEPLDERSRTVVARMQPVHARPSAPKKKTAAFNLEQVTANTCKVSDGGAEYVVEWSVQEAAPEPGTSLAASLLAGVVAPLPAWLRRAPVPQLAAAVLVSLVVMFVARARSVPHAATAIAAAAHAAAPAPTTVATAPTAVATAPTAAAPQPAARPVPARAPATVSLEIATRPPGAAVSLDGTPVGVAPLALEIAAGPHQVSLSKARYAPVASTVAAPGKLDIALERPRGTLVVESTPSAADVLVQGRRQGKTPLRLDVAAFQRYDVQVAFAGGKTWRQKVYLKGPRTSVQARLADARLTRR